MLNNLIILIEILQQIILPIIHFDSDKDMTFSRVFFGKSLICARSLLR